MDKKTVGVFFGGRSNEREISVITGMLAVNLLRRVYRVVPVYLLPEGGMATGKFASPKDFSAHSAVRKIPVRLEGKRLVRRSGRTFAVLDCALNCCHGGMGEDGTLSALFRFHGLPSASPDTPMSAIFMDKTLSKLMAKGLGIPTLPAISVSEREWLVRDVVLARVRELGYPVVVKPARLGSSIGIRVAADETDLCDALSLAFRLDGSVLIERYLAGKRDINCAACRRDGRTVLSPLEEVFSDENILTFSEKYEPRDRSSEMPARIPEETAQRIAEMTRLLYETFGGRGVVRADFLVSGGEVYFNELNTVPGSLACYLFGRGLKGSRDFLFSLIEEAAVPETPREVLETGILESDLFSGPKVQKHRMG